MSKILNDITTDSITLTECLQRLLVIANKTGNKELADWCIKEINGYENAKELPEYRKYKSRNIYYSGLNGGFQIKNSPLQPGYLSVDTISKVEDVGIFEGIIDVERLKDSKEQMYRDLTPLAVEVAKNTRKSDPFGNGVQCLSISQLISNEFYTKTYSAVKTRIINLLCSFEAAGLDLDNLDVIKYNNELDNNKIYNEIIVNGSTYVPDKKTKKIFWEIIIPIITAIIAGVLVYLITSVWIK